MDRTEKRIVQERLQLLYDVTALRHGSAEERIRAALEVVTTSLGLETGFLSRIAGERFTILHSYGAGRTLEEGAEHPLAHTYCSLVLAANGVKSIDRMRESEHAGHPCQQVFGLESYLGAAVFVHGELYGTVCFSSRLPRAEPFTPDDESFVVTLARWVGITLELQEAEERRRESEERFRILAAAAFEAIVVTEHGRIVDVNASFSKMFGYARADALDHGVTDFVFRQDAERIEEKTRAGDERAYEVTARRGDGSTFVAEMRGKSVSARGREVGITAIHDITERKRVEAKLQHDALRDPLTGIRNRAAFTDALHAASERARRHHGYGFAVLFIDFDRFKLINDSLGHHVGDGLLIQIAKRLVATVRGVDTVARLGGDEFVILLDGVQETEQAVRVAQKLQKDLAWPFHVSDQAIRITASIGIAMSTSSLDHPDYLIRNADAAMYRAKSRGRASFLVFDEAMQAEASSLRMIETNLRRAVEEGRFALHYQPIVRLRDGSPVAYEALLRWPRPDGSSISPMQFIPVAEETGLIVPLGYWALEEACRQAAAWRFGPELRMHVNLSVKQFLQPDLCDRVEAILQKTGLEPDALCLEITESTLMSNPKEAARIMVNLKEMGARLHLDDFGTGYSSLSYLHRFPIDALKVDRSFVQEMGEREESTRIVETVLALARNLRMQVVAEGIERLEHAERLKELGCEYGQGFLYARPASADRTVIAP